MLARASDSSHELPDWLSARLRGPPIAAPARAQKANAEADSYKISGILKKNSYGEEGACEGSIGSSLDFDRDRLDLDLEVPKQPLRPQG